MVILVVGVVVPFLALVAAIPVAWGWGLSWLDIASAAFYLVSGFGVTVGFHRYFTHGAFKAVRGCGWPGRGRLARPGGPLIQWVADHRRHHAFADREGDPHSPWRYGASVAGLAKGLFFAHCGWLFQRQSTNRARFAPDLIADRDTLRVDRLFPALALVSVLGPPLLGGLLTMSWHGALTAFFWATPGPHRAAAPRHLVDQLDLPRVRRTAFRHPGHRPGRQLLAVGDHLDGRELAQLAPRRPDLRPPRRDARSGRSLRPADLAAREGRLGNDVRWPVAERFEARRLVSVGANERDAPTP